MLLEPSWTVASADGSEVAGYELGGTGPTLLIAHATGFCGPMYRQLGRHLVGHARVVTFDFRGHGRSAGADPIDLGWARMAEDVAAVVRQVDDGPVHGFGHSMGGAALLLAERERPGTFASLFVYEPIVFPDGWPTLSQNHLADGARRRREEFASSAEVLARYASRPPLEELLAGALVDYVDNGFEALDGGRVRLRCTPQHEAEVFEGGQTVRLSTIADVDAPTVVAVGNEAEGPAMMGRTAAERLPAGSLIVYPNVGHFGPFQDPWTIAGDIRRHVAGVS